jgi:hypothetical protein
LFRGKVDLTCGYSEHELALAFKHLIEKESLVPYFPSFFTSLFIFLLYLSVFKEFFPVLIIQIHGIRSQVILEEKLFSIKNYSKTNDTI